MRGRLSLVTNFLSGNVSVIEVISNSVIATVSVVANPFGIAITPAEVPPLDIRGESGRNRFLTQTDLFHVPRGKNVPRIIHSENPLIGKEMGSTFNESADTLGDGDLLIFHNLEEKTFATPLEKAISGHTLLSSSRLSQSLLKEASSHEEYAKYHHPKVAIALSRIT